MTCLSQYLNIYYTCFKTGQRLIYEFNKYSFLQILIYKLNVLGKPEKT